MISNTYVFKRVIFDVLNNIVLPQNDDCINKTGGGERDIPFISALKALFYAQVLIHMQLRHENNEYV